MAVYGFKENHCKEEVISRTEIETKYKVQKSYIGLTMSNETIYIVAKDNTEYRISYTSGVTNCNISITAPEMISTSQVFESMINIYTGSISPTATIGLRVNMDSLNNNNDIININGSNSIIVPMGGTPLPKILKSNMVYQIKIWFDGFSMCYSWAVHGI